MKYYLNGKIVFHLYVSIMAQTSREIVERSITFNYPERMPRQLWALPWAEIHHPRKLKEITEDSR